MSNIPRNVIFDSPGIVTNTESSPSIPIPDIESIIDSKTVNNFLLLYLIVLVFQYICIFISVPFEDVYNRPPMAMISCFYDGIMVCNCFGFKILIITNMFLSSLFVVVYSH